MNAEARLVRLVTEISALGIRCLVMGGHAVRYYGFHRDTVDFDLHLAVDAEAWTGLFALIRRSPLLADAREGSSWRPSVFKRFQVGTLPDGREEWLDCWRQNHLLAPFTDLWARRERGAYGGGALDFIGIEDLIRSKETERNDDWLDVARLEAIADERNVAAATTDGLAQRALAKLRSRPGYDRARQRRLFASAKVVEGAASSASHPISLALLAPSAPREFDERVAGFGESIPAYLREGLAAAEPGSPRHFALVEAVRRLYQQRARDADRADKERARREEPTSG